MHIALVRQRFTPLGGAENTLAALAREFARRGHRVTVVAAAWVGASLDGVGWQRVPVGGGRTLRLWSFARGCRRLLPAGEFDVVFSLERIHRADVYRAGDGCHREWLARRRAMAGARERLGLTLSPFHLYLLGLERELFASPRLRYVIANSVQVQEEIVRHYGYPTERIRVVYNGVDRRRFYPSEAKARESSWRREVGLTDRDRVILFVGSGFHRKGLAFAIRALAQVPGDTAHLVVVGAGRARRYMKLAQRLGVMARVHFQGPQGSVEDYYRGAAAVVLPTLYDPCSNVALEALACGVAVVTSGANGAAEFIARGENGAVVTRPDDVDGLATALGEWLERAGDPRVRQAALTAVAGLSWERTAAETLGVLEEAYAAR